MRSIAFALVIVSACSFAAARQSKKPPKAPKAQAALSASYARAALLALKAIENDTTVPPIENGKPMGDKNTIAMIDAARAAGRAAAAMSATDALSAIYEDKLLDNNRRDIKKTDYETDSGLEDFASREMVANQRMESDSELLEMEEKEKACLDAMDAMLRSRSFSLPPACVSWSPALRNLQKSK